MTERNQFQHLDAFELHQGNDSGTLTIGVPGLLMNAAMFAPVLPLIHTYGDSQTLGFRGEGFNPPGVANELGQTIAAAVNGYHDTVVILAVSLGGLLMLDALNTLHLTAENKEKLRLIVVDAPSGIRDIDGPNAFMRRLNQLGARYIIPHTPNAIGKPVLRGMMIPPKPGNIERFSRDRNYHYLGEDHICDQDHFVALVRQFALTNMQETPFRRYRGQVAYLGRRINSRPWKAARNIRGVYMSCTAPENETVVQPQASETWRKRTGFEISIVNQGAHAACAEMPGIWDIELDQVYRRLLAPA